MSSRNISRRLLPWLALTMMLVGSSKGDFKKDKDQCGESLISLATCLPYVGGQAKAPTMDCCAKLKPVLDTNRVCLCILVKDRNEPDLGVKLNATLALGLPDSCHLSSNITECPKLMNLPPNSPEAKIFEDYGRTVKNSNITTVTPSGNSSSDVGRGKKWLGDKKICGALYMIIIIVVLFQVA